MGASQNLGNLNPYVQWLDLPEKTVSPNHYELLGLKLFEGDARIIKEAYYRRVAKVSIYQHGKAAFHCERLLAELANAKNCLIDQASREKYNAKLKSQVSDVSSDRSVGTTSLDRVSSKPAVRKPATVSKVPLVANSSNGPGPRENYSEGAKRKAALFQESRNEPAHQTSVDSGPASRSPFGILSVVRTPNEIFQEIVKKRGLTPYQAEKFVDEDAENLIIGPYVLEGELGSGSCGTCYVASRISTGDMVSLRVLPTSYTKKDEASIKGQVRRTKRLETKQLQKPVDAGFDNSRGYIASNLIVGEDLHRLVKRIGPLTVQQSLHCILRALEGLAVASKSEIVHRELRPSKMVISRQGILTIRDIAIAQTIQARKGASGNLHALIQAMPRHHLDYIAPEVLLGNAPPNSSPDIYSLGCILIYLLTGKPMYEDRDPIRVVIAHRESEIPSISKLVKNIPPRLEECILKMVAKSPKSRFAGLGECYAALREVAKSLPRESTPVENQWGMVDETMSACLESRPAMWTLSLRRIIAISALLVLVLGGMIGGVIYGSQGNDRVVTSPAQTEPAKVKEPKIVVPGSGQSVPIVAPEESFSF